MREKDVELANFCSQSRPIPAFAYLDPWGYKGLSLKNCKGVFKVWGCDCIFFCNFNQVDICIANKSVRSNMKALLGFERLHEFAVKVKFETPEHRQSIVLAEISNALMEMGGKFVLPSRFKNDRGLLTHHLIFVSKHFRRYELMKNIMSSTRSKTRQGNPPFCFSNADESMPLLFSLNQPLEELQNSLLEEFSGQTLTMREIHEIHSVNRPFISLNYKKVLLKMEEEGVIKVASEKIRRAGTFSNHMLVNFPD